MGVGSHGTGLGDWDSSGQEAAACCLLRNNVARWPSGHTAAGRQGS
jgi:hypothetical protein